MFLYVLKFFLKKFLKKLKHFQTLHAFAFHTLGLNEDGVMQPYHYEDLGKILGIRVNYVDKFNDQQIHYLTSDNIYFQTINKMQNQDVEEYEDRDIDPGLLRHIIINLAEYKKKNNLLDFNDMIKRFVNKPELCPNLLVSLAGAADALILLMFACLMNLFEA